MIVCLRTVAVPAEVRDRYLQWIADAWIATPERDARTRRVDGV